MTTLHIVKILGSENVSISLLSRCHTSDGQVSSDPKRNSVSFSGCPSYVIVNVNNDFEENYVACKQFFVDGKYLYHRSFHSHSCSLCQSFIFRVLVDGVCLW